jgi:hypothetical protein
VTVQTPAVGDYRWHRHSWRRWSGRDWATAKYSLFPTRLTQPQEWATYPELPMLKRQRLLERAVDLEVLAGATVVHRSDRGVTVARPRSVTHLGHFILTLLTGGLWGFVWLAVVLSRRQDRVRYEVDPWGNIWPVTL